jgi:alpha-L-arabinofuranosidase
MKYLNIKKLCLLGLSVLTLNTSMSIAQTAITVDVAKVLNDVSNKPVGINMDYLMDGSYISPAPAISTTNSIKNMGMKFLRYPGGEKSDNYLWSVAPWLSANPRFARVGSCEWPSNDPRFANSDYSTAKAAVQDFDEFMTMSRTVGGEPLIVVAYDAIYKPSSCNGKVPTKAELLTNATEWVRYANLVKGYKIKYWMIGNESWNKAANGSATAAQYRDDVIEFSKKMKAVDPTIKIIANGDVTSWWSTVLPTASPYIDYLGVSEYPVWNYTGGYSYYQNNTPNLMGTVEAAIKSINTYAQTADRSRIKVISTEINSIDWAGAWPDKNDLGHALNCFEIFGEHLKNPKVEAAIMWNTRWINNTTKPNDLYDAISKTGSLQANGLALSIWGNYLLPQMVSTTSTTGIRTFASYNPVTKELNVYVINKETGSQTINLSLANYVTGTVADRWEYKGAGPDDIAPTLTKKGTETPANNKLTIALAPVSITLLTFKVPGTVSTNPNNPPTNSPGNFTGIEDINPVRFLNVYPNPARDVVNIKLSLENPTEVNVKVVSIDGKLCYNSNHVTNQGLIELNTSRFAKGVYIMQMKVQEREYIQKLVLY